MVELVAERGFDAVTVRGLTGRAGVSQATLYAHFTSKDECFRETYDLVIRRAVQRALVAHRRASSWQDRIQAGVSALVDEVALHPNASRLALVDCYSAWPDSLSTMRHTSGLFDALLLDSVAGGPDGGVALPPWLTRALVAGISWVLRDHLLTGRDREISGLAKDLVPWALSFLGDGPGEPVGDYELKRSEPHPRLLADWRPPPDDRSLLIAAAARIVAEEGFDQLSVARIRATAGVPRSSFHAQFDNPTACFLAAIEHHARRVSAQVAKAQAGSGDWSEAICQVLAAYCELAKDERLATMMFVEIFTPGPEGLRLRSRLVADTAASFRAAAPADRRPSAVAAEASVGAIWTLAYKEIAAGRAARMLEISGPLAFIALAPSLGSLGAVEAIRAQHDRGEGPAAALATNG
jgi:AcrR family transcriptional regulator